MTMPRFPIGDKTTAAGPDPNRTFDFRYRVVSLKSLEASHDAALAPNPDFPAELQPRIRSREASRQQIRKIASNINSDALLTDVRSLDRGPMIIGPDNVVESGNGRVIALKLAELEFPDQFRAYVRDVRARADEYGIDPADFKSIKDPVLVRERTTEVDRIEFAALANQSAILTMSPLEQALQDSNRLSEGALAGLAVGENQSIDQALKSPSNRPIVDAFLKDMGANEQAALIDAQGNLNLVGVQRVKAAVFAKVFPGASGQRLTQAFFESIDPTVKNVENAIFDALPSLAKSEGLARSGQRNADLALGDDLAKAVDMIARLKQENISVEDFLRSTIR